MVAKDREGFLAVLNGMAAMKRVAITPEAMALWWACMADWDIADFKHAAVAVMKSTEFMPTPKDFEDVRRKQKSTPGEAWGKVLAWIKSDQSVPAGQSWSNTERLPMGEAAIDRAVAMVGGYYAIGHADYSDLKFIENRFLEHYETSQDVEIARGAIEGPSGQRKLTGPRRLF